MTSPDGRILNSIFPQVPQSDKGLLSWAKRLIISLEKLQNQRERVRVIEKVYDNTLVVDAEAGNVFKTTTIHGTGDCTLNLAASNFAGWLGIIITNDSTSGKTITFGTGFKPTGTLVGTAGKTATLLFVSDGSNFYEVARTTGIS